LTISIGFCAEDGIVLGADREVTSSFNSKYERKKVFSYLAHGWAMGITYAGYCDVFEIAHEKVKALFHSIRKQSPTFETLMGLVEDVLRDIKKERRSEMKLSMLLAPSIGSEIRLYASEDAEISPAGSWKVLGYGDTPLTHFLVATLRDSSRDRFDSYEALLLAAYVVVQANKYTQYCSGGPDLLIVKKHGITERLRGEPPVELQNSLNSLTREVAEMWGEICELGNDTPQFLENMDNLSGRLAKLREDLRFVPRIEISGA
jgi:20S proteasome alpha/beta subunit